jgi:mevalonate kinase
VKTEVVTTAYAAGKVILFGEHAVVYGRPAIAVPVTQVRATAALRRAPAGQGIILQATDLRQKRLLSQVSGPDDPLYPIATTVGNTLRYLGVPGTPDLTLKVSSTVPMARGLGSGAALATAIVRALAIHCGRQLGASEVSDLVYQTELIHHGTPSGIDNTVIAFQQPVFFVRGQTIEVLHVGCPFWLVIGDTGIASPTRIAVGDVRRSWQEDPIRYETWFDAMASIAVQARQAIAAGHIKPLGSWMDQNQQLLEAIGVSCPELDRLVAAARQAGAWGAKLCGGGRGGNMIALVAPEAAESVAAAVRLAGAVNTIITCVNATPAG